MERKHKEGDSTFLFSASFHRDFDIVIAPSIEALTIPNESRVFIAGIDPVIAGLDAERNKLADHEKHLLPPLLWDLLSEHLNVAKTVLKTTSAKLKIQQQGVSARNDHHYFKL